MGSHRQIYEHATPTDNRIAIVGSGPAGLACAHRLAMYGHDAIIFDAKPRGAWTYEITDKAL